METKPLTIRAATAEDYPLIEAWGRAHGRAAFDARACPPTSFMVEDARGPLVFCKLYLSVGVGVAFLEGLFSRPGERPSAVVTAVEFMVEGVKRIAAEHDYGVLICHTFPAAARKALGMGFVETQSGLVQMVTSTREAA